MLRVGWANALKMAAPKNTRVKGHAPQGPWPQSMLKQRRRAWLPSSNVGGHGGPGPGPGPGEPEWQSLLRACPKL
eukprot:5201626-Alexandrium_andersonii.AAC.1